MGISCGQSVRVRTVGGSGLPRPPTGIPPLPSAALEAMNLLLSGFLSGQSFLLPPALDAKVKLACWTLTVVGLGVSA